MKYQKLFKNIIKNKKFSCEKIIKTSDECKECPINCKKFTRNTCDTGIGNMDDFYNMRLERVEKYYKMIELKKLISEA